MILGRIGWVEEGILGTQKRFLANATYNANMFSKADHQNLGQQRHRGASRLIRMLRIEWWSGQVVELPYLWSNRVESSFSMSCETCPDHRKGFSLTPIARGMKTRSPGSSPMGLFLPGLSFCFGRLLSEAQLSFCEFASYQKFNASGGVPLAPIHGLALALYKPAPRRTLSLNNHKPGE